MSEAKRFRCEMVTGRGLSVTLELKGEACLDPEAWGEVGQVMRAVFADVADGDQMLQAALERMEDAKEAGGPFHIVIAAPGTHWRGGGR